MAGQVVAVGRLDLMVVIAVSDVEVFQVCVEVVVSKPEPSHRQLAAQPPCWHRTCAVAVCSEDMTKEEDIPKVSSSGPGTL